MYYFPGALPIKLEEKSFCLFDPSWEGTEIKIQGPENPEGEKVKDKGILPITQDHFFLKSSWKHNRLRLTSSTSNMYLKTKIELTWGIHFILGQ